MLRPTIQIHNALTGEDIVREMNDEEFAQYTADIAAEEERRSAEEAEIAEKAAQKAALLGRLGLTEEEFAILNS